MAEKHKPFPEGSVCKPCWELRYCPYGPLVEFFPLYDGTSDLTAIEKRYSEVLSDFARGGLKTEKEIWDGIQMVIHLKPGIWREIQKYDPVDVGCRIWGHICPVFLSQSRATETKVPRREGRYIPREVMLRVVRRDGQICQECRSGVRDDEVEFDHIIPLALGGPTSAENLRLLCRACNRKKSKSIKDLLPDP